MFLPMLCHYTLRKKKLYSPFSWMGFNCLKATEPLQVHSLYFSPLSSQKFLILIHQPLKGERLSQPWSHPVVLNMGSLNWESSVLTTRSLYLLITGSNILLLNFINIFMVSILCFELNILDDFKMVNYRKFSLCS